jgi:hypothetical protein
MKRFKKTLGVGRIASQALLIFLLGWIGSATVQAALLGLDSSLSPLPDLYSPTLQISYNATTNGFNVTGFTGQYDDGTGPYNVTDGTGPFGDAGTFNLYAQINNSGTLVGGTVEIKGEITDLSIAYGVLLKGTLTQFGYQDGGAGNADQFEFLFTVTGGSLASAYGSVAGSIINTSENTAFNGSFSSNFDNSAFSNETAADSRPLVPEPSTGLLVTFSVFALGWVVRRVPLRK